MPQVSTTTAEENGKNKFEPALVQATILLFAVVATAFAINSLAAGGMGFAEAISGIAQMDPQVISLLSP